MGLFVIDQVIDHLHVFELNVAVAVLTAQITHDKRLSRNSRPHNARVMWVKVVWAVLGVTFSRDWACRLLCGVKRKDALATSSFLDFDFCARANLNWCLLLCSHFQSATVGAYYPWLHQLYIICSTWWWRHIVVLNLTDVTATTATRRADLAYFDAQVRHRFLFTNRLALWCPRARSWGESPIERIRCDCKWRYLDTRALNCLVQAHHKLLLRFIIIAAQPDLLCHS